jgi:phosphoribosylcarboxyaminoimidazole (NCAIR) mutase
MQECADVLKEFGVRFDMQVLSAHRTPNLVAAFATQAMKKGRKSGLFSFCATGLSGPVAQWFGQWHQTR